MLFVLLGGDHRTDVFVFFRQGIAARYAARQASSARATDYGDAMRPQAEMAWAFVQDVKRQNAEAEKKAKL